MLRLRDYLVVLSVVLGFGVFADMVVRYALAEFYFKQGTQSSVERAIGFNSSEPSYYLRAAALELGLGNDKGAVEALNRAIEINEDNLLTRLDSLGFYAELAKRDSTHVPKFRERATYLKTHYSENVYSFVKAAKYEKQLGLEDDYQKSRGEIKRLRPDLLEWYQDLLLN